MSAQGFGVGFGAVRDLGQQWGDTSEVVRRVTTGIGAGGAWAPRVSGAVNTFATRWARDLDQVAHAADQIDERLDESAVAYERTDETVRARFDRLAGQR